MESLLEILKLKENVPIAIAVIVLWYLIQTFRSSTEANFRKLDEKIHDVRTELKAEIQDVRAEIHGVRAELKAEIQDVRAELKAEIQDVRTELKTEIQGVRAEIQDTRHELNNNIKDVKLELNAKIDKLSYDVNTLDRAVIKFESKREAESKFEKMINDAIYFKSLAENKA